MNSLQRLLTEKPIILQLLRFVAIGILNTALDFIILNFISKALGITAGFRLGTINVIGFAAAVIQSYYWNRYWTFDALQTAAVVKNFFRLIIVGGIGAAGFIAVLVGAQMNAAPLYYILVLVIFLVAEIVAWVSFGLGKDQGGAVGTGIQFVTFAGVSVVGLLINSGLIALVSQYLVGNAALGNPDLLKNIAKIAATGVSLIWNFVAYKMIVFRK